MDLKSNINKVHIDLLLVYDEVSIVEKSNLKFGNYFEIVTTNEGKQLKMIISKKEIEKNNFNWFYFSNPLNENSDLVERNSNVDNLVYDVRNIFEKKRFSEDYLNKINEDFLICKGEKVKDFLNEIKSKIGENYELKDNSLKFIISGDEKTIKHYENIAKKYNVEVKFEA